MGQQQLQQGQIQGQQQQLQSGGIDLQLKQQALKNATVTNSFLSDPHAMDDYKEWQSTKGSAAGAQAAPSTGTQSPVPLHPLAQYLAEKKNLPLYGPGGALEISDTLTKSAQAIANLTKTQGEVAGQNLTNHSKQLENFDQLAEPVLSETDAAKQTQGLANLRSEIQQHPELYPPEAAQHIDKLNSVQTLQQAFNTSQLRQMVIEEGTKQAEQTAAQQKVIPADGGMSPDTQQQVNKEVAINTDPRIQAGKEAVAAAEGQARANVEAAMARGSNAALAKVPPHLVAPASQDAQKAGADYAQSLSVTQRLKEMMDDAKSGNVVAYQLLPQEGALQITTSQGVKRINMAEIQNYGGGSLWQRMQGHLGKALTGKSIPNSVLDDMSEMQDIMARGNRAKYENTINTINQTYGASFKPVDMQDIAPKSKAAAAAQSVNSIPQGNITVKLANGRIGHIAADKWDQFLKDNPGATRQ